MEITLLKRKVIGKTQQLEKAVQDLEEGPERDEKMKQVARLNQFIKELVIKQQYGTVSVDEDYYMWYESI